jgi:hypothetical protein
VPKFYLKWQLDPARIPTDPKEAAKSWISMLEMVKADKKAGLIKDWGAAAGGMSGYSISEAENETELFTTLLRWMPYVHFEAIPVLTVDQTMAAIKKVAAAAKK